MNNAATQSSRRPIVGIPADRRMLGPHVFHAVGEKYIQAIERGAGAVPFLIPVLPEPLGAAELLERVDAIFLTGSPSNVEPRRYGGPAGDAAMRLDPERDETALSLIPLAVRSGVPLLAVCRGFQEINVAYGGTLWQKVHEQTQMLDHREPKEAPLEEQYAPVHTVTLERGGMLHSIAGGATEISVNSLHSQGIRELGPGLVAEARAPDGLIEGFRVADAPGFALAVQWHPEWQFASNTFSRSLFESFGTAARQYAASRNRG